MKACLGVCGCSKSDFQYIQFQRPHIRSGRTRRVFLSFTGHTVQFCYFLLALNILCTERATAVYRVICASKVIGTDQSLHLLLSTMRANISLN